MGHDATNGIRVKLDAWRAAIAPRVPLLVSLAIPLLVLGPLLGRGYILHYDMVFSPHVQFNFEEIRRGVLPYNTLPLTAVIKALAILLPVDIIQKLILYAIFLLATYSMYRALPVRSPSARLIGGIAYSINPFTYDRLMAGHWNFLLAYSITPLVCRAFYRALTVSAARSVWEAAGWWSLAALLSVHHIVILGLLFICLAAWLARTWSAVLYVLGVMAGVLVLSSWWLVPLLLAHGSQQAGAAGAPAIFATKADTGNGLWFTMLSLQGFWYAPWQSVRTLFHFWPVLTILLWVPVSMGVGAFGAYARPKRRFVAGLVTAAVMALFVAAGASSFVGSFDSWLYAHIPAVSLLREPQKMVALVALLYATLIAYGLDALREASQRAAAVMGIVALVVIALMVAPMFWGAHRQLQLVQYPASWERLYQDVEQRPPGTKVLILPWELYITGSFTRTLVADPAQAYFGDRAITSSAANLPHVVDSVASADQSIDAAIRHKDRQALIVAAKQRHACYIALIHSFDDKTYDWVFDGSDHSGNLQDKRDKDIKIILTC